jgi:hypothetical protein
LLEYKITHCFCDVRVEDIFVIPLTTPIYYGALRTNTSPFSTVLQHYKCFQKSLDNTLNADCWNSRPQIAHVHHKNMANTKFNWAQESWKVNTKKSNDTHSGHMWTNMEPTVLTSSQRDNEDYYRFDRLQRALTHQQIDCTEINFYPLTDDSSLNQLEGLKVNMNYERMYYIYKESICNVMGIPTQLAIDTSMFSNTGKGSNAYTSSSRLFTNSMTALARLLSSCLQHVYTEIYKEDSTFIISPLSRLEIQSYDTLQSLLEAENVLPPETRKLILQDIHFQLTGRHNKM